MESTGTRPARSISAIGMAVGVALLAVLIAGTYAWSASRGATEGVGNNFVLHMTDYAYAPAHMTWRAGETVTVTLVNESAAHPGKPHEWMVGRTANTEETPFGKQVTDGFEQSFFDGVDINVVSGANLTMLMPGMAKLSGKNPMSLMVPNLKMAMGEEMTGFMPVMAARGNLTISFKVPDKPGEWTYGCFQQSGQHFINGMRGTITVTKG